MSELAVPAAATASAARGRGEFVLLGMPDVHGQVRGKALRPDAFDAAVRDGAVMTDLLLALDPSITLIVIEHDMDIALRVAERVTMMHDGRVIVEGTPAEIRANEQVHDLYLGRGHRNE